MRKSIGALIAALFLVATLVVPALADTNGFDQYGYNRTADVFVGPASGWCLAYSEPADCLGIYSNDLLIMKWNAEWDRGNLEDWAHPPYAATLTNEWNGMVPGGSGYTEHVKIVWSSVCAASETPSDGGYCIWGQFEAIMDQGLVPGVGHVWYALATPNGFGVAR